MAFNAVYFQSVSTIIGPKPSCSLSTRSAGDGLSSSTKQSNGQNPRAFTCAVSATKSEGVLFAGKSDGEVLAWQLSASRRKATQKDSDNDESSVAALQTKAISLGSHKGGVTAMAYYPSRKLLFSGSADSCVCVWDPMQVYQKTNGQANGYRLQLIPAHDATISAMAVHCNILVTGSVDKTVKIWGFDERREGLALPFLVAKQAFVFDNWITSIYASLSKATEVQSEDIFVGDGSGNITTLHSVLAPMIQKVGGVEDNGVLQVELVRHSKLSQNDAGASANAPDATPRSISAIFPLPNVNSVITLGFESSALITDAVKGSVLGHIGHPDSAGVARSATTALVANRFIDILFFPEREEIVLLDNNGCVFLWGTRTNQFLSTRKYSGDQRKPKKLIHCGTGSSLGAQPAYMRPLEDHFWALHDEGVDLLSIVHVKAVTELQGHEGRVLSIQVNHLSEYASLCKTNEDAEGSRDASRISDSDKENKDDGAAAGDEDLAGGASDTQDVAFVTAGVDNKICLWSSRLSVVRSLHEKYSEISCFLFTPHLDVCITGHDNGSVKFWGLSRERSFRFSAHDNTISFVGEGFHRYDKRHEKVTQWRHLFTTSYDGCLAVWEIPVESSKPKCEGRVRVSNSELLCATYDSMNFAYIVGDNNGCITMWSVEELKPLRAFQQVIRHPTRQVRIVASTPLMQKKPAHSEAVTSLALDGNIAVSGGEDRKLYLWNTITGDCIKELDSQPQCDVVAFQQGVGEIQQLQVMQDTGDVLVCTRTGMILQYSQSTGHPAAFYKAAAEVSAICWNPYSHEVMVGLDSGTVLRVPLQMFKPLTLHEERVE